MYLIQIKTYVNISFNLIDPDAKPKLTKISAFASVNVFYIILNNGHNIHYDILSYILSSAF